jgi:hypothetical protein
LKTLSRKTRIAIKPKKRGGIEMSIYRFRAECRLDVDELLCAIWRKVKHITSTVEYPFPDVEVEIEVDLSLDELRDAMRAVPDGHVMLESSATSDDYTGERDISLSYSDKHGGG